MKNSIQIRSQRYFKLSSAIAQLDNAQLHTLLESTDSRVGWGGNHTLNLGGAKVFVKRIPVTDTEHANLFSTRNMFNLPTYYNYGVGSYGFGVSRELLAHVKTTNWVLNGEIETFPLMYHYRVVAFSGERAVVDMERHRRQVNYWGGDPNIGRYMLDRAGAKHELLLFLEHMPHVLQSWLPTNLGRVHTVLEQLRTTVTFLREHGVIHFDAHFHNILTDGQLPYITDFGLVLDRNFDLSAEERAFFKAHTFYDYGQVISCVGYLVHSAFQALSESDRLRLKKKYGMQPDISGDALFRVLLNNLESIHSDGSLKLPASFVTCVARYRSVVALMDDFYMDLRRNSNKDTKFPHVRLRQQLKNTGFL